MGASGHYPRTGLRPAGGCGAGLPVCGSTGHSCPVFSALDPRGTGKSPEPPDKDVRATLRRSQPGHAFCIAGYGGCVRKRPAAPQVQPVLRARSGYPRPAGLEVFRIARAALWMRPASSRGRTTVARPAQLRTQRSTSPRLERRSFSSTPPPRNSFKACE